MLQSYQAERFQWLCGYHNGKLGIEYRIQDHGDYIYFGSFCRADRYLPKEKQTTKGNGRKALKELCEVADVYGQAIELYTVFPQLYAYYEEFGFVCTEHRGGNVRRYRREPKSRRNHIMASH